MAPVLAERTKQFILYHKLSFFVCLFLKKLTFTYKIIISKHFLWLTIYCHSANKNWREVCPTAPVCWTWTTHVCLSAVHTLHLSRDTHTYTHDIHTTHTYIHTHTHTHAHTRHTHRTGTHWLLCSPEYLFIFQAYNGSCNSHRSCSLETRAMLQGSVVGSVEATLAQHLRVTCR
jgi:hypothetical protein